MAPIRIGILGLPAAGGWANVAHLPYLRQTSKYKIVAIANSSVASAQAAISALSLDPTTKAYDSPEDIAADPDVDLLVCSVNVSKHLSLIKPALEKGKMAYVEWPLGKNLEEAEELTALAQLRGAKTVIGLQGRLSPLVQTVRRLVKGGSIGRVLSSSFMADVGREPGASVPLRYKYFSDSSYGGNLVTIYFGHIIDHITYTLGELESFSSLLQNHFPVVDVVDNGQVVETGIVKDTDDEIVVHGKLTAGAVVNIHIRGARPFPGTPGLQWRIVGDKGEILVTGARPNIQLVVEDASIQLHDAATGNVRGVPIPTDEQSELPVSAQNIARLYEAFAADSPEYGTFQSALIKHRLINELFQSAKEGRVVSYMQ